MKPAIPDDGYGDGGEPYTDEELAIINKVCPRCGDKIPEGTTHRCGIVPRVVRKGGEK